MLNKIKILLISLVGGFLGAFGGVENTNKIWRRIFVPLLITSIVYNRFENLWALTILFMIIPFSRGYGVPCSISGDSGSTFGKFFYKLFKGNLRYTNLATRGAVGLMVGISLLIIPIITKNVIAYLFGCLGIIGLYISCYSIQKTVKVFGKKLLLGDLLIYGGITLVAQILILL